MTVSGLTLAKTQSDDTPFQRPGMWGDSPAGVSGAGSKMATSAEEAKVPCAPGMWEA